MIQDTRIQCPHCKVRTWATDLVAFMRDHDRPQGGVCRRAQVFYREPKQEILGEFPKKEDPCGSGFE